LSRHRARSLRGLGGRLGRSGSSVIRDRRSRHHWGRNFTADRSRRSHVSNRRGSFHRSGNDRSHHGRSRRYGHFRRRRDRDSRLGRFNFRRTRGNGVRGDHARHALRYSRG
jgi:hypothetical protein